jgi:hypothetical protein
MGWYAAPGWQPLNDSGEILASGTLTFSLTGTSTAKNVYSDKALTSALSNPLTLDAAGRVTTNIFMLEDEGYRVVLKNSAGTTIWTRDEQFGLALAVDEGTRRKEIVRSPFDHAAVGDGATNDAVALAAALAAADGVLDLEGKTYRCDSTLALRSGITIRNGTIDFSNAVISAGLEGAGTAGAALSVSAAATGGQSITPSSTTGISPGDLIRIRSSDIVASGHRFAELFRVEQVSGGNVLVDGTLTGTYSTTPLFEEITPISNIRLENLTIIAPSGGYAIDLSMCEAVRMINVVARTIAATESIRIISCYDVDLSGVRLMQRTTAEAGGIIVGDASAHVRLRGCSVERSTAPLVIGDDYATEDGLTRDVTISDCQFVWCQGAVIAAGANGVVISGCQFYGDIDPASATEMLRIGGNNVTVRDCEFRDFDIDVVKITALLNTRSIIIEGNRFVGISAGGQDIEVTDTTYTITDLVIRGNRYHATFQPLLISGTSISNLEVIDNAAIGSTGSGVIFDINTADNITNATISLNKITAPTSLTGGIRFAVATASGANSQALIYGNAVDAAAVASVTGISVNAGVVTILISDNMIYDCRTGISATGTTTGVTVNQNTITTEGDSTDIGISIAGGNARCSCNTISSSGRGIFLDECLLAGLVGNIIASTGIGIEIDNTTSGINGCVISGGRIDSSGSVGIEVDASEAGGSTALSVTGVYVNASTFTIQVTGIITGISISGCTCVRDNDDAANISIAGDGAGNITQCTVVGNHLHNGTYGIDVSNNATTYHSANTFSSMATGNTNGTFAAAIFST